MIISLGWVVGVVAPETFPRNGVPFSFPFPFLFPFHSLFHPKSQYLDNFESLACIFGWNYYKNGGKCYKYFSASVIWNRALELCKLAFTPNGSGNLASVTSEEVLQFVGNLQGVGKSLTLNFINQK